MNKKIGILAHVDAGKTTFSEQLFYHTKTIKERGRVDHKDAFLDSHEIEKERGITVFADQGKFTYRDSHILYNRHTWTHRFFTRNGKSNPSDGLCHCDCQCS